MAVIISVIGGGSVVEAHRLGAVKNGVSRIHAVQGARYVLADTLGGGAAAGVVVKRLGKDLVISQGPHAADQDVLIIEDFYGSAGQLVTQAADGQYQTYVVVTDSGAVDASELADGASSLLTLTATQPEGAAAAFQFSEGKGSLLGSALASAAAIAGGVALSTGKSDAGKVQAAPASSGLVLDDQATDTGPAASIPAASIPAASESASAVELEASVPAVEAQASAPSEPVVAPLDPVLAAHADGAGYADNGLPVVGTMIDDHGAITGAIANGGYTDDGRPQIIGKAEPGVMVHVYRGVELIGHSVADANGNWSFVPKYPFADGTHSITIIHEYPNGDTSEESDPYVIVVDRIIPDPPAILGMSDDEGRITGAITDQMITDDNRPTVDGTGEPNSTLIVFDKGREIDRIQVAADGTWSYTPSLPLADGYHALSYAAVDRAGNASERSAVSEFVVDTRPEKINIYYADDNVGDKTGEVFSGGITDDATPMLFGTATAGGIVKIYEGDTLLGQVAAGVDGTWQFTPELALGEGVHTFHATVTLIAKGESGRSKPFTLEVDITVPGTPSIEQVLDDVGAFTGPVEKGQVTDDATPTLSGKAEKGSTVRIYSNGVLLGSTQADGNGVWTYTPAVPLQDGPHAFTVTATDVAGNQTASEAAHEIHIDTLRPSAPTIVSVEDDVGAVRDFLQNGDVTDDTRPEMKGTAEAHSTVIIRDHGVEIGRVQANAEGLWSFTPELALAGGAHAIAVVSQDRAGNTSVASDVFDFSVVVVPETPAAAPTIVSLYDDVGLSKGLLGSGAVTDDSMPLVSGRGEPNTTIILKDNGVEVGRALVDALGEWNFLPSTPLSFGLHNLVATALDMAGNSGGSSSVFGFRVVELGRAGALENFNTLALQGVHHNYVNYVNPVVLPTGVTLTGTFCYVREPYINPGQGAPRPEDGVLGLGVDEKDTVRIGLPSESDRISFHMASHSPCVVSYFDAVGVKIAEKTYAGITTDGLLRRYVFEAPAGSMIASMEIKAGTEGAVRFDALQWGERYITDVSIAEAGADGFGGRYVYGMVSGIAHLKPNEVVQITTDGGKTWTDAAFSEGSWAATQKDMPPGNWVAEVRVVDRSSGLSFGVTDSKVVEVVGPGAPVIVRIEDAEGMYTAAKAADGSVMEVSIEGAGAKLGDTLHIRWGNTSYDHILTKDNIDTGHVSVRVPKEQTTWQGASKDFLVTAQVISTSGAIGALSKPYEVVGTYYLSAAVTDNLQKAPQDNAYIGAGFKITTEGVIEKTALSASTHAGLTLNDVSQANALFTFDKPVREISLRLSGIDSAQGVKIQLFDVKGGLIEEQMVYGDATAFHAKAYSYTPKDERVDIGSFKIVANESAVTVDGFTRKEVTHFADSHGPNVIESSMESYYGGSGDDIVTLDMRSYAYFQGVTAGIHGGDGIDTLRLGKNAIYSTDSLAKVSSMEIIELQSAAGGAWQSVKLDVSDVLRNGGTDVFYTGDKSRVQMMINDHGSSSSVDLFDYLPSGIGMIGGAPWSSDLGDWVKKSPVTINGITYNSFQHSAVNAEVLVLQKITVYIKNRAEYVEPWKEYFHEGASEASPSSYFESSILHEAQPGLLFSEPWSSRPAGQVTQVHASAAPMLQAYGSDLADAHHGLYAY